MLDCNLQPDTLAWLFAQAQSCPPDWLVVDAVSAAKCHKVLAHLAQVQVLKLNRLEAKALTGLAIDSLADAQRAAHWCWQRGVRHTVLSLGEQGVCWVDATGQAGHLAAPNLQIANTNGAGDALLAGVIYGQLAGFLWPQSVQWGMSCAALTLAGPTANTPYLTAQAVTAAILQQERNENQPHDT